MLGDAARVAECTYYLDLFVVSERYDDTLKRHLNMQDALIAVSNLPAYNINVRGKAEVDAFKAEWVEWVINGKDGGESPSEGLKTLYNMMNDLIGEVKNLNVVGVDDVEQTRLDDGIDLWGRLLLYPIQGVPLTDSAESDRIVDLAANIIRCRDEGMLDTITAAGPGPEEYATLMFIDNFYNWANTYSWLVDFFSQVSEHQPYETAFES